jgi:hypothetical protein
MSSPDKIIELKTKVQIFENELNPLLDGIEAIFGEAINKNDASKWATGIERLRIIILTSGKLLNAYREYTKELEKVAPRN